MKTQFSTSELAALGLKTIPMSERGIRMRVERENWPFIEVPGQGGKGGVRREYQVPEYVLSELVTKETQKLLNQTATVALPALTELPVTTIQEFLTSKQAIVEGARKGVLLAVEQMMALANLSQRAAINAVLVQAKLHENTALLATLQNAADNRGGAGALPTLRTIQRWFDRKDCNSLAPEVRKADMSVPVWANAFLSAWQTPQKPSITHAYKEFCKIYQGDLPTVHQVRRFIAKLGNVTRQHGRMLPRELRNIKVFVRRVFDTLMPTDIYTADGHTFDAEVQHPVHGRPWRPEITTVADVATRRIVGWSIDLAESGLAVLAAVSHAVSSNGIPARYYIYMQVKSNVPYDQLFYSVKVYRPDQNKRVILSAPNAPRVPLPLSADYRSQIHATADIPDLTADYYIKEFILYRKVGSEYIQTRKTPWIHPLHMSKLTQSSFNPKLALQASYHVTTGNTEKKKDNTEKNQFSSVYKNYVRPFSFLIVDEIGKDGFLVRKIYDTSVKTSRESFTELVKALNLSDAQIRSELFPEKFGLSARNPKDYSIPAAKHALGDIAHSNTPYISTSNRFPDGAGKFHGKKVYIDISQLEKAGVKQISEAELIKQLLDYKKQYPHTTSRVDRLVNAIRNVEGEVLLHGEKIPAKAIFTPETLAKSQKGVKIGRGVMVLGIAFTAYDMSNAANESIKIKSVKPVAAETIRQVGGWGGAALGAKAGAAGGALLGIETGPGAIATAAIGGIVGGVAGYYGADWIADYIYED